MPANPAPDNDFTPAADNASAREAGAATEHGAHGGNGHNLIGITMGCPAGIGPEIILRLHQERELAGRAAAGVDGPPGVPGPPGAPDTLNTPDTLAPAAQPVVLGDIGVLAQVADRLGLQLEINPWQPGRPLQAGALNVLPVSALDPLPRPGRPTVAGGGAMGQYIERAVELVRGGVLAAMTTCPIGKDMLNAAGYHYPGHTEMLATLCNCPEYAMMMAGSRLRVSLVTIHRPLATVPEALSQEAVVRLIRLTARSLQRDFALARPRLAVAGLNPHAGEQGMFGGEEQRLIAPAVARAAAMLAGEAEVSGPRPPDTVFYQAARGDFDAVVAMYHDQGLIPFKLLHFKDGVNVTIGLPIIRTSVDHGTAYDIAGRGVADHASLRAAFNMAAEIASRPGRRR